MRQDRSQALPGVTNMTAIAKATGGERAERGAK